MAPPVRLLPSAGSLTNQDAPVLVTDNPEPCMDNIRNFLLPELTHISIFGLDGREGLRYSRCTVNV